MAAKDNKTDPKTVETTDPKTPGTPAIEDLPAETQRALRDANVEAERHLEERYGSPPADFDDRPRRFDPDALLTRAVRALELLALCEAVRHEKDTVITGLAADIRRDLEPDAS